MIIRYLFFILLLAIGIAFVLKYLKSLVQKVERDESKMYKKYDGYLNPSRTKNGRKNRNKIK